MFWDLLPKRILLCVLKTPCDAGQIVKNRDCPAKNGTSGHLIFSTQLKAFFITMTCRESQTSQFLRGCKKNIQTTSMHLVAYLGVPNSRFTLKRFLSLSLFISVSFNNQVTLPKKKFVKKFR